nr:hypothetical protein [Mycoplasmopsis bovis]
MELLTFIKQSGLSVKFVSISKLKSINFKRFIQIAQLKLLQT